jgi:hypothetical protein
MDLLRLIRSAASDDDDAQRCTPLLALSKAVGLAAQLLQQYPGGVTAAGLTTHLRTHLGRRSACAQDLAGAVNNAVWASEPTAVRATIAEAAPLPQQRPCPSGACRQVLYLGDGSTKHPVGMLLHSCYRALAGPCPGGGAPTGGALLCAGRGVRAAAAVRTHVGGSRAAPQLMPTRALVAELTPGEWAALGGGGGALQLPLPLPLGPEYSVAQLAAVPGAQLQGERTVVQGWLKARVRAAPPPPPPELRPSLHSAAAWGSSYATLALGSCCAPAAGGEEGEGLELVVYDDMAALHRLLAPGEDVAVWQPLIRAVPGGRGRHLELQQEGAVPLLVLRQRGEGAARPAAAGGAAEEGAAAGAAGAGAGVGRGAGGEEEGRMEPPPKRARLEEQGGGAAAAGTAGAPLAQLRPGAAGVVACGTVGHAAPAWPPAFFWPACLACGRAPPADSGGGGLLPQVRGISSSRGGRPNSRLLRLALSDGSAEVAAELVVGRGSALQLQLREGHVLLLAGGRHAWLLAGGGGLPRGQRCRLAGWGCCPPATAAQGQGLHALVRRGRSAGMCCQPRRCTSAAAAAAGSRGGTGGAGRRGSGRRGSGRPPAAAAVGRRLAGRPGPGRQLPAGAAGLARPARPPAHAAGAAAASGRGAAAAAAAAAVPAGRL